MGPGTRAPNILSCVWIILLCEDHDHIYPLVTTIYPVNVNAHVVSRQNFKELEHVKLTDLYVNFVIWQYLVKYSNYRTSSLTINFTTWGQKRATFFAYLVLIHVCRWKYTSRCWYTSLDTIYLTYDSQKTSYFSCQCTTS